MNTVGLFAGRGDVVVAMALAGVLGLLLGWWLRGRWNAARQYWSSR